MNFDHIANMSEASMKLIIMLADNAGVCNYIGDGWLPVSVLSPPSTLEQMGWVVRLRALHRAQVIFSCNSSWSASPYTVGLPTHT